MDQDNILYIHINIYIFIKSSFSFREFWATINKHARIQILVCGEFSKLRNFAKGLISSTVPVSFLETSKFTHRHCSTHTTSTVT